MPFVTQEQERCTACGKIVYQTEKTIVDEKESKKVYHKSCIRCCYDRCNKVLSLGEYSSIEGKFYCKPHFKQLFATKGNYEESFGIEKEKKWDSSSAPKPASFVPIESTDHKTLYEKKETSDETAAKFRKFREEGETDKCIACQRIVYATEKVVIEETGTKKTLHKACLRCTKEGCGKMLDLGSYTSIESVIYCKPHYQQLFKSKGNYDESFGMNKSENYKQPTVITEKLSFIPKPEEENKPQVSDDHKTSDGTAEKIRKWREEGQAETCAVCAKTVFLAEKLVAEEKNVKKIYHKGCFKCASCNVKLDLRNYGSSAGKIYCATHLKEVNATNRPTGSATTSSSGSFIPEVKDDKSAQKSDTPSHIAEKFKGLGGSEKCKACGKTVYATEKVVHAELTTQSIYHKGCLKCSKCNISLDVTTMKTQSGVMYCKVHLPKAEMVKSEGAYFVSPLKGTSEYTPQHEDGATEQQQQSEERREAASEEEHHRDVEESHQQQETGSSSPYRQSPKASPKVSPKGSPAQSPYGSPRNSVTIESEERKTQVEQLKQEAREENRSRSGSSASDKDDDEDRRRKREERDRQREEEERKFNEEREQREREREERRKKRDESSTTTEVSEDDAAERRKKRKRRQKKTTRRRGKERRRGSSKEI